MLRSVRVAMRPFGAATMRAFSTGQRSTVLSGIQPTGELHLGNYLGAVQRWVSHAEWENSETLYMIVDLHALTTWKGDAAALRHSVRNTAITLLACGIDPSKSALFVQSQVPQHTELCWILSSTARMGWLNRMTQFKSKSGNDQEGAPVGLFTYPVLQAADILIYRATHVPVGEDQKQHLELARDIAAASNHRWGDVFQLPQATIEGTSRVMSLQDGTSKMSKSDDSDAGRINLTDDADTIRKKIRRAKTDSIAGLSYDPATRPEISNLVSIYAGLAGSTVEEVCAEMADSKTGQFKDALADLIVSHLVPISDRIKALREDPGYVDEVLKEGAAKAHQKAEQTMVRVRDAVGLQGSRS